MNDQAGGGIVGLIIWIGMAGYILWGTIKSAIEDRQRELEEFYEEQAKIHNINERKDGRGQTV